MTDLFTLRDAKFIQRALNVILECNTKMSRGLCSELHYEFSYVFDHIGGAYHAIKILMGNHSDYIGTEPNMNPERVMFAILFTTISAQELLGMLNSKWVNSGLISGAPDYSSF